MTWTQPLCRACWDKERPHDQPPPRVELCSICDDRIVRSWGLWVHAEDHQTSTHVAERQEPAPDVCCMCGNETLDGIHVRYNPNAVPYPTED